MADKSPIDLGDHPLAVQVSALHESGEGFIDMVVECATVQIVNGALEMYDAQQRVIGNFDPGYWRAMQVVA